MPVIKYVANCDSPTGYNMHFPAILSNYNSMTAYICRRFIPTTAFFVQWTKSPAVRCLANALIFPSQPRAFSARRYASGLYAMACLSVCPSQVGVLSKWLNV